MEVIPRYRDRGEVGYLTLRRAREEAWSCSQTLNHLLCPKNNSSSCFMVVGVMVRILSLQYFWYSSFIICCWRLGFGSITATGTPALITPRTAIGRRTVAVLPLLDLAHFLPRDAVDRGANVGDSEALRGRRQRLRPRCISCNGQYHILTEY